MIPDSRKHVVEIEIGELGDTPVKAPRRKLWDFIPNKLALVLIKWGYNPPATPYEVWLMRSVMLRGYYNRFYKAVALLNAQSLAIHDMPEGNAPGSSELN